MRLRITFAKTAAMKYTGHLDLHLTWERTIRRARLPLAYSEGFNPHPKINLGAALPLGFTSECELIDIWLGEPMALDEVRRALEKAAPPGIQVLEIVPVGDREPAMQTQIVSADFQVLVDRDLPVEEIERRIEALLGCQEIPRERRGKRYDLRPLILSLAREEGEGSGQGLRMRLAAREGATGRPEEVLAALGLESARAQIHRRRLNLAAAPDRTTVGAG